MNYIFFLEKKQLLKKCRFRCYWIPRWRINKQLCLASSHWNWCWNISNLWYYKPSKLLGKLLKFIKCTVNLDSVKLWICTLMYGKCRLFKKTTFVSPDWIPPGTIAGNHRLFLLVHAPFHCESCWQPPLCPPTFVRWSTDVGFRCFWNRRFVWSTGIEPVSISLNTNPVTGCGQLCLTSVI